MKCRLQQKAALLFSFCEKKAQRVQGIKGKTSNKPSIMDSIRQPDFNT